MKSIRVTATAVLLLAVTLSFYFSFNGSAAPLNQRSVIISSGLPSAVVDHSYTLTPSSTSVTGSIVFDYCDNSPLFELPCTAPAGLSLTSAILSQQSGNVGFNIDTVHSTANRIVLTRVPSAIVSAQSKYVFSTVTNPSGPNQTTFVRISTYASTDGTGSLIDKGTVAFSTQGNLSVGAYVPPYITLCVGVFIDVDCTTATGSTLDLGEISPTNTAKGTSQYSTSTNDPAGYNVYVLGDTITSGNNPIAASINQASKAGVNQFGINLRQNTTPFVGTDPVGVGTGTPGNGYDTPNVFSFVPGSLLSSSPIPTDYTRMTVSYIVNAAADQPAGIYATTLTYMGTAQF